MILFQMVSQTLFFMSIAIFLFFILLFYLDVDLYLRFLFKLLLEQWSKLPIIRKNTPQWKDISIIELYLCVPFSDVTLDESFSYMTITKTGSRNCLFSSCLNSFLVLSWCSMQMKQNCIIFKTMHKMILVYHQCLNSLNKTDSTLFTFVLASSQQILS